MSPLDTLHGLTVHQLDAIRGYADTATGISMMHHDAPSLGAESSMFEIGRMVRSIESIHDTADPEKVAPYADGVRFALRVGYLADQLAEVEAHIARARRERSDAMGRAVAK